MDSDDEENHVIIGAPLPALEEGDVLKKPTPFSERAVKDARGRAQRFHGAFSGGFSAGYFNTVGSKEGWKPSTFVSSRSQRQGASRQHAEQFMDEEDLGEHGIAPRRVATTDSFISSQKKRPTASQSRGDDLIPAAGMLLDIIQPAKVSVGVKLLRKLGWRDGQGVGAKRQKKKKRATVLLGHGSAKKVYGCAMRPPSDESESESDTEFAEGFAFAPKDVTPITFTPKDNVHGLGYRGIDPKSAFTSGHLSLFDDPGPAKGKPRGHKKGMQGQAFGVGALEGEDDDVYTVDSMSNYDMVLGGQDADELHGWTAPGRKSKTSRFSSNPSYVGAMLEGFHLASEPQQGGPTFPPPALPRNFRPYHIFTTPPPTLPNKSQAVESSGRRTQMSATERSEILDERPEIKSVFDLVSDKDKKSLEALKLPDHAPPSYNAVMKAKEQDAATSSASAASAAAATESPVAGPSHAPASTSAQPQVQQAPPAVTSVDEMRCVQTPLFASGASGFKPFVKDPVKQARYEQYLELKKSGKSYEDLRAAYDGLTEWERDREREEFERAAQLYRPLSMIMAQRFTTANQQDDDTKTIKDDAQLSDQAKAAQMKMFGKLTRETIEWHPHKDLCKRFNIPNPYPQSTIVGVPPATREKFNVFDLLHAQPAPVEAAPIAAPPPPATASAVPTAGPLAILASQSLTVQQASSTDVKTDSTASPAAEDIASAESGTGAQDEESRPPMDLFKAIFSDSESSSDEEKGENEATPPGSPPSNTEVPISSWPIKTEKDQAEDDEPPSSQSVTKMTEMKSSLDSTPSSVIPAVLIEQRLNPVIKIESDSDDSADAYAPPLPPPSGQGTSKDVSTVRTGANESSSSHKHKDTGKHKKRKKEKKVKKEKKKHKKHKKKSKKSKKVKKSKKESSGEADSEDSSDDSSDDATHVPSTAELLQRVKNLGKRPAALL